MRAIRQTDQARRRSICILGSADREFRAVAANCEAGRESPCIVVKRSGLTEAASNRVLHAPCAVIADFCPAMVSENLFDAGPPTMPIWFPTSNSPPRLHLRTPFRYGIVTMTSRAAPDCSIVRI